METEPHLSFGDQLRRLRQAAGLSQEELAERAGLTATAVGALERGERRHPYPHTLQALSDAFALSPSDRATLFASVPKRGSGGGSVSSEELVEPGRWVLPPLPLTPLVGRERDIAMVTGLLQHGRARIVTLTGPAGVGKTRLAIEIARSLHNSFVAGAVWVDLAPVRDPDLVLSTIARALGLAEAVGQSIAGTLASYLDNRHLLLVLDNFEHLLAATPSVIALLERCQRLSVLATSREALRVRGEQEMQVPPLRLPDLDKAASAESIAHSEAVDLFLQRVRATRPDFKMTDADASRVAAICARLDGVPLALELAAVQMKYMSPTVLLDRLNSRLAILEGGPRDLPARQRSLRAAVAWSYELLTTSEQNLFRRLAIFAGGFTQEAVQGVCSLEGCSPGETYRTLTALVDKSVVQSMSDSSGEFRFAMLETIREYARERLAESGEETFLANRHASYFCDLAEAAAPHITSARREVWLRRLDAELDNLRTALMWTTTEGDVNVGLRLAGGLAWFWTLRGYISEGTRWTDLLLSLSERSGGNGARAYLLYGAAALAWKREDYPLARRYAEESVTMQRPLGDVRRLALSLSMAGLVATSQGDLDRASQYHEECLSLFRGQDDRWGTAYALANLGDTLFQRGDLAEAERVYNESLEKFEQVEDQWGQGIVFHTLGNVAWAKGDVATARARYSNSLVQLQDFKIDDTARCLIGLAAATLGEGESDEAEGLLRSRPSITPSSRTFFSNFGTKIQPIVPNVNADAAKHTPAPPYRPLKAALKARNRPRKLHRHLAKEFQKHYAS